MPAFLLLLSPLIMLAGNARKAGLLVSGHGEGSFMRTAT
jgi:hypothetical protein